MDKDYTVEQFVKKYKENSTDDAKQEFLHNSVKTEKYLSYNSKIVLAKKIVENSSYAVEPVIENGEILKDENGNVKFEQTKKLQIDSNRREILFIYTILQHYTNIEMDGVKILEEFDMLNEAGLIDKIIAMIPEREIAEFDAVVKRTFADFMENNYETHAFIINQVQRVADVLNMVLTPIAQKIADMPDGELEKISDKIIKFAEKKMKS